MAFTRLIETVRSLSIMQMMFRVPRQLAANCQGSRHRRQWLDQPPRAVAAVARRWSLTVYPPFDGDDVSCAWVAPVRLPDAATAVLKLGMPHMEGDVEAEGLRFWDGDPTVQLLRVDEKSGAML